MERNGLQKCTVLGYKNGIKRVTKMEWIGLQEFQKPLSAKLVNISRMHFGYVPPKYPKWKMYIFIQSQNLLTCL